MAKTAENIAWEIYDYLEQCGLVSGPTGDIGQEPAGRYHFVKFSTDEVRNGEIRVYSERYIDITFARGRWKKKTLTAHSEEEVYEIVNKNLL